MTIPLHVRVADELRRQIIGGQWPPGTSLPSEARLCERFGASRGTIRSALSALRREGLIVGGQGRPPVVRDTTVGQSFETLLSFTAWARQIGRVPGQRTVEITRRGASAAAAAALDIPEGAPAIDVLRVRTLDGEPVMLERATFVLEVGRLLFAVDPDANSIYASLADQGVDLHSARHTVDAIAADETDAELLGVPRGAPLLRERRRATDAAGRPLEYGDDRYRPDRITFTIDNVRPGTTGASPDVQIIKKTKAENS
ncbi:GntR family transcriptional regulator [Streptomyces sp. NPDC002644]